MKVLLLGKDGQIGRELQYHLSDKHEVLALGRQQLDITDGDLLRSSIAQASPDIIINSAAYTAVDLAEKELELAYKVNAHAPGVLAEVAQEIGALLVHYSTDYVFDGQSSVPYREVDPVSPLNVYGKSKYEGEQHICSISDRYLILRTSWVYAAEGENFLNTMLSLMQERDHLDIVNDQVGAPTWAGYVANLTAQLIEDFSDDKTGIYHLTNDGQCSWYDFAVAIFDIVASETHQKIPTLSAVNSNAYHVVATRPSFSVLDNNMIRDVFGVPVMHWREGLLRCMQQKFFENEGRTK